MALSLNHLNARQRDAVLHGSGPLLILAGAGSGKTSTMAYRIAHLVAERHVPGSAILGLSFTNKAAHELRERVIRLVSESVGRKSTRGLTVTTFHSLCARLLRAHADVLGFQTNFTILDQNDQTDILKQVLRNIKIDERRFDPDLILFEIGQAKNRFLSPSQAEAFFLESGRLSSDYAIAAASSFGRYQDQLRVLNAMDFDDLIYYTVQLLENHAEVRDQYNYKFRHILVDEYQDTNPAQFKILRLLTEKQQNLCVVGDDDQSIYSWRGADPTHILEFSRHYPAAQTIALEQNYRSTSRILEAANSVIEKNKHRYPKKLWSERGIGEPLSEVILEEDRGEADFVAEEILRRSQEQGRLWSDFAILYRSNPQSRVFEEALRRRGVPYRIVGGLSFLARKEVKDVLSYWRLVQNQKDDASLRRILNWPTRGIGKTSIESVGTYAFTNGISVFEGLAHASQLAPKAASSIYAFREMILNLNQKLASISADPQAVAQWAKESLERIQVKRAIEEESDDPVQAAKKWENVEELIHSIGQFKMDSSQLGFESSEDQIPETVGAPAAAFAQPQYALVASAEANLALGVSVAHGVSVASEEMSIAPEMSVAPEVSYALEKSIASEMSISSAQLNSGPQFADDGTEALLASWETVASAPEVSPPRSKPGLNGLHFMREFLNRMTLEAQEAEKDEDKNKDDKKNQVTLLTLHGAKGLEYPIVFLVGMEDGFLPHRRTLEEATDLGEERRLCYVGITRAKDFLFITRAKNRIRYGKPVPRVPSRFLDEIPKDLLVRMDQSGTPDLSSKEAQVEHETKVKSFLADIRANLMKK